MERTQGITRRNSSLTHPRARHEVERRGNSSLRQEGERRIAENKKYRPDAAGKQLRYAKGNRVVKSGKYGEVVYVNDNYTVRNNSLISKHVFAGNTRVCSKVSDMEMVDGTTTRVDKGIYYYHGDHLGSSSVVTDRTGGFYESLEYFPYGETWVQEKVSADQTSLPYKFTSKEQDPETGLYYFGARYYDAVLSRWVSADPAFQYLNLYQYCRNNPLGFIDPDGQFDTPPPSSGRWITDGEKNFVPAPMMPEKGGKGHNYNPADAARRHQAVQDMNYYALKGFSAEPKYSIGSEILMRLIVQGPLILGGAALAIEAGAVAAPLLMTLPAMVSQAPQVIRNGLSRGKDLSITAQMYAGSISSLSRQMGTSKLINNATLEGINTLPHRMSSFTLMYGPEINLLGQRCLEGANPSAPSYYGNYGDWGWIFGNRLSGKLNE